MTALYSRDQYIYVPVVFQGMQIRGWGNTGIISISILEWTL